jgi:anhydro-N-acetylmuramic acid kinase
MGAPLIPAFHKYLYAENDMNKVIFNIGGIANGTYLKGEEIFLASDVGPGNCLIDFYASKYYGFPFDNRGEIANQGVINEDLLIKLNESVKNMSYPRADDKNDYYNLVNDSISNVAPENIMRTVTEFTALKIEEFCKYCDSPDQVIFHGGGTKNLFLMKIIQSKIDTKIRTTDDEISSKFVEAAAFAYLAYKNQGIIFKPKL